MKAILYSAAVISVVLVACHGKKSDSGVNSDKPNENHQAQRIVSFDDRLQKVSIDHQIYLGKSLECWMGAEGNSYNEKGDHGTGSVAGADRKFSSYVTEAEGRKSVPFESDGTVFLQGLSKDNTLEYTVKVNDGIYWARIGQLKGTLPAVFSGKLVPNMHDKMQQAALPLFKLAVPLLEKDGKFPDPALAEASYATVECIITKTK